METEYKDIILRIRKTVASEFKDEKISDAELLSMFNSHTSDLSVRDADTQQSVTGTVQKLTALADGGKYNEAFDGYVL
jgi:hypothetical protein